MTIAENVQQVQQHIADACAQAQRSPDEVTLIAISKRKPPADILAAVAAGVRHFGENRVQESQDKIPAVQNAANEPLTWHMVGHVQSRKARDVLPLFDVLHSLDSVKLAERLSRLAVDDGTELDVLVQINVSGEASKSGFDASGWSNDAAVRGRLWDEIKTVLALPALHVRGLMTMAPLVENPEQTRPVFSGLAALRGALVADLNIPLPELSMGMTDDYPVAIEEGATMIRIGRAIFGERD
jgi:hypothetical protein